MESKAHVAAILKATPLPGMLYNNPIAYGTDFLPEQIEEPASEFPKFCGSEGVVDRCAQSDGDTCAARRPPGGLWAWMMPLWKALQPVQLDGWPDW